MAGDSVRVDLQLGEALHRVGFVERAIQMVKHTADEIAAEPGNDAFGEDLFDLAAAAYNDLHRHEGFHPGSCC